MMHDVLNADLFLACFICPSRLEQPNVYDFLIIIIHCDFCYFICILRSVSWYQHSIICSKDVFCKN